MNKIACVRNTIRDSVCLTVGAGIAPCRHIYHKIYAIQTDMFRCVRSSTDARYTDSSGFLFYLKLSMLNA